MNPIKLTDATKDHLAGGRKCNDPSEKACEGDATVLFAKGHRLFVGIDLGGTFIKGGIVDDLGNILIDGKRPTEAERGEDAIAQNIAALVCSLLTRARLSLSDVVGVGLGAPGMIDGGEGKVLFSGNLGFRDYPLVLRLEALTGLPVRMANDANVATLGEARFGGGRGKNTVLMLTLGTGVGGGAVLDGRLFEGNRGAGTEMGHVTVIVDGEPCKCGQRGCLEAYASATALIRETRRAMQKHPESRMWQYAPTLGEVDGRTAFLAKDEDEAAASVVSNYLKMLGIGLTNYANIFRPDVILLGGGVSAEGEGITRPLQAFVDEHIYAGARGPRVEIKTATLGNRAGLVGAAALWM